jgi:hypothetical protein
MLRRGQPYLCLSTQVDFGGLGHRVSKSFCSSVLVITHDGETICGSTPRCDVGLSIKRRETARERLLPSRCQKVVKGLENTSR